MKKQKAAYVCTDCGGEHSKWHGQCSHCKAWNTLAIFHGATGGISGAAPRAGKEQAEPKRLIDIELSEQPRLSTGFSEFDRVLGGGLVKGSATLIGGSPGAGKSTLLLQTLCRLAADCNALYVSGEESLQQIALRAKRLSLPTDRLMVLAENDIDSICAAWRKLAPQLTVIDSIQVMRLPELGSATGSVAQVRECAARLIDAAKQSGTALLMVGHVTKEGALAGPKTLEHMIDVSLMLEATEDSRFRLLRGQKNRFGSVNELGVFGMTDRGMREVKNPSAIFLSRLDYDAPGSVAIVVWEGSRPLLVELQALVDDTQGAHPRRLAVGLEANRLAMLSAVLHRHGGVQLADQDLFANIVGGIRVLDTGADLGVLLAAVSSFRNRALPRDLVTFGEVGLAGEVRPVPGGEERLREAAKHGFRRAIIAKANMPKKTLSGMAVSGVDNLSAALAAADEGF